MHPEALFHIGKSGIYLYGLCIGVGLIACIISFYFFSKKRNMTENIQDFTFFVAIAGIAMGFLFAKLFQTFDEWIDTGVWDFYGSGITAMGGIIGGAACFIAVYFTAGHFYFKGNLKGIHIGQFKTILLVAPLCILVAHAFGRIGCLMAGCCHGTYLGKEFVVGGIYMKGGSGWGYYVPTQLYEALFLFLTFGVLSFLFVKKRANYTMPAYLISYALFRFVIEYFRGDYRGFSGVMSPSQWTSVVFLLIGAIYIGIMIYKKEPFHEPLPLATDSGEEQALTEEETKTE